MSGHRGDIRFVSRPTPQLEWLPSCHQPALVVGPEQVHLETEANPLLGPTDHVRQVSSRTGLVLA